MGGDDIPLAARIFAVVDSFDAMTSDRPYREALPTDRAMEELVRGQGTQFDPQVVEMFISLVAKRPWTVDLAHGHDGGSADPV